MTSPEARIQQSIHYFIKPATRLFMAAVWSQVKHIFDYKERAGWRSKLVMRLRAAFDEFFETDIDTGLFRDKNVRQWVRQLAYMILLQMDVEAPLTEKRWKIFTHILKRHGLI